MATKPEVLQLLTSVEVAFPGYFQNINLKKLAAMASLWAEMFQDTDTSELAYAVKSYIANDKTGFPPSIGQLNEIIQSARGGGITEIEAWQMVKRAIRKAGGGYEAAKEAWDELPPEVREPITPGDLIEWGYLNSDTVNSSISAAYRKSFSIKQQRSRETKAIPQSVRNLLDFKKQIQ